MKPGKCKLLLECDEEALEWDIGRIRAVLIQPDEEKAHDLMIAGITVEEDALNIFCLTEDDARAIAEEIADKIVQ